MSGKELLEGLNYIDDRFVEEAELARPVGKRIPFRRIVGAAACAAVLLLGIAAISIGPDSAAESMGEYLPDSITLENQQTQPESVSLPKTVESVALGTILLRVDSRSGSTVSGTVADDLGTTHFEAGAVLTIILKEDVRETAVGAPGTDAVISDEQIQKDKEEFLLIRILSYDPETGEIVGELVPESQEGE